MVVTDSRVRWRRWGPLLAILFAALVVNAGLGGLVGRQETRQAFARQSPVDTPDLLRVVPLAGQSSLLVTLGNELSLLGPEGEVRHGGSYDASVGDAAYSPSRNQVVVGTADGVVHYLSADLRALSDVALALGRILFLAPVGDDALAVASGTGAYGDRFYVTLLGSENEIRWTYQLGKPIKSLAASGDTVFVGDENAWVTALDQNGVKLWEMQLRRNVTTLYADQASGAIYAGDEVGNVYQLEPEAGAIVWENTLSQFPIVTIRVIEGGHILAGNRDGGLHLLGPDGKENLRYPGSQDPVVGYAHAEAGSVLALRRSGEAILVDTAVLRQAQLMATLRPVWTVANALLALAGVAMVIRAIDKWRRWSRLILGQIRASRTGYLFILPMALFVILFTYVPAILAFYYSLTDYVPGTPTRFIGLENFRMILTRDTYFWSGMGNMFLILVTSTLKVLTMPLLVSLVVFWLRNEKAKYWYRTAVLIPSVVPGLVSTLMWKMMYNPDMGFVNKLLSAMGLGQWQRAWLGDENTALWAIIFAGFPWVSAFAFLVYLGGLININPELFDAAAIDGVGWWNRLLHVEWPLLAPQRNLLLFFTFLGSIQGYASIWVYTRGGPGSATYVPALQLFLRLSGMNVGYAAALGVVLFVMVLVLTVLRRKIEQQNTVF